MLTRAEKQYFDRIKGYVFAALAVSVPMYPADHRAIASAKGEEVLGCCHRIRDRVGHVVGHVVTIDEPYIRACYLGRCQPGSPFTDAQLIETMCHEIAHLTIWAHGHDHTRLTGDYFRRVTNWIQSKSA